MRVHAYASTAAYAEHITPVFAALPEGIRGVMFAPRNGIADGAAAPPRVWPDGLYLIAGYADTITLPDRPYVYIEHGAGQVYDGAGDAGRSHPSYSAGRLPGRPVAFLVPNMTVGARRRMSHPDARVFAVGCPKLDTVAQPPRSGTTIGWTWHWDCTLVPETRSAFPAWKQHMPGVVDALRRHDLHVVGHAHPRCHRSVLGAWRAWGVPTAATSAEFLAASSVVVADNTSVLYEAAALGTPVVAVNAPWYRRDVHHGLRFWEFPGPTCDTPDELVAAVVDAATTDPWRSERAAVASEAYAVPPRYARHEAVRAVVQVLAALREA